jgi:DmsE family decaheme c-type cytochrome
MIKVMHVISLKTLSTIQRLFIAGLITAGAAIAGTTTASAGEICLACHEEGSQLSGKLHRAHGQTADARSPMGSDGCASCHGTSAAHVGKPREFPADRLFTAKSTLTSDQKNEACIGCHTGGHQKGWSLSEHAAADITCVSCHNIHGAVDPVQERISQSDICLDCHTEHRANQMKFSRHPTKEGVVACSDCHNAHGGKGPSLLTEATVNETCYQCHTEKRGPMLFEHEPVQDNCSNCHTPHGSVNDNMLVTRAPLLCQQCHIASRHPGTNYINESELATLDVRLVGKSCMNCHGQVHGSNHPAGFTFRR